MSLPFYYPVNNQMNPLFGTDSLLSNTSPASSGSDVTGVSKRTSVMSDRASDYANMAPNMPIPRRATTRKPEIQRRRTETPIKPSSGFRFFVVDDPAKLKDREQMRENRKHVMYDYLNKERKKPMSSDIRVTGAGAAARKRKRLDRPPPTSSNPNAPANILGLQRQSTPWTQDSSSIHQNLNGEKSMFSNVSPAWSDITTKNARIESAHAGSTENVEPLVREACWGLSNSQYLQASAENIPGPITQSYLGSNIQPFGCWPTFQHPDLNLEELKWSCSRKFGTQGLADHWVPTLLKAKHAFLSTICISASHDDIMNRGFQQPHERAQFGSEKRMEVRHEVLSLINEAMQDPQMQTTDATMISILHMLNSEIMGCDDTVMKMHQHGLHGLVRQRGGLDQLGVDGQLASILTITMYIISALRETEPHEDFIRYGTQKGTKPPNDQSQLPESPVYCRLYGYLTVKRAAQEGSPTLQLLEDLRQLTHAFVRGSGSSFVSPLTPVNAKVMWQQSPNSVSMLKDKIFALPNAEEQADAFSNMSDKYAYEALRLVALVYSLALADEIPFSKAAAKLTASYRNLPTLSLQQLPTAGSTCNTNPAGYGVSWHLAIKSALIRSNISDCWDHMAGVLFWISLIAGACANPDSPSNKARRELSTEEEEGRKYLAAIAVRCSIVLSFQYGGAILETLKRIVGIEQALAKADADRGALDEWLARENVVYGPTTGARDNAGMFGPVEEPFVQRTFADFAQDFMSDFV